MVQRLPNEAGIAVPEFCLSDNSRLFVMRRFDRDDQLNPIGFEDMAVLMGLPAEKKYSKSYFAIAKAIRLFYAPDQVLARSVELSEQAPKVIAAIRRCAELFMKTFG
ncbi:hypothetical protein AL050_19955 [Pseudomonas syringae pv. daphniphylli]|nr:hypothetical protein AL050_19955 [Pseudomonas syringae pv. daphniphylli]